MDGQTAEMPPLLAWGFGLLLVLLAAAAGWIAWREHQMRAHARPATVKRVLAYQEPFDAAPSLDGPVPMGGNCVFTTIEHGDDVVFCVVTRVLPGQRVGIYTPPGRPIEEATAFYPF